MAKRLVCIILAGFFVFVLTPQLFTQQDETITISTYYPSPFGSYNELTTNTLFYGQSANPPFNCDVAHEGATYYNSNDHGIYFCNGTNWLMLQPAAKPPDWIGGAVMGGPLMETYARDDGARAHYFNTAKTWTHSYNINNLVKKDGSKPDFSLITDGYGTYKIKLTTTGDLTAGNYKIVYGGGKIDYFMGDKFYVQLYVLRTGWDNWSLIDNYYLENPAASDGVKNNFWEGSVEIPVRDTTFYIYNNWNFYVLLRITPKAQALEWGEEMGPEFPNTADGKNDWEGDEEPFPHAPKPVFDGTEGYVCNPDMKSTLCGQNPYTKGGDLPGSFHDYRRSYYYMKILDTCAGGIISGISIDLYKVD